jgi:hypothetical protein
MKMILHHLRKDIRAQFWLLVLWALMLLVFVLPDLLMLHASYDVARTIGMVALSPLPMFVVSLGWVILLARLVQSEPVTGSTSFWLTRPVPKSVFLASKAAFIFGLVLLPAFVPLFVRLILFNPDPELARAWFVSLLATQLIAATIVIWLATYSPNLLKFAGLLALGFLLFMVLMEIASAWLRPTFAGFRGVPVSIQVQFSGLKVLLPGLGISLVLQHWLRRSRLGFGVGVVAIVLAAGAQIAWPFSYRSATNPAPSPVGHSVTVNFSPDWATHVTWRPDVDLSTRIWESVACASLEPEGLNGDSEIFVQTVTATFQPTGGTVVPLPAPENAFSSPFPVMRGNYSQILRAQLRTLSLQGVPANASGPPQELFRLDSRLSSVLRDRTGTLALKVAGQVDTLEEVAVIPLNQPNYVALGNGGFTRVAPIAPGSTEMVLWEAGPTEGPNRTSLNSICVLVDPTTGTSKELSSGGGSSSSFGGFGFSGDSMVDSQSSWRLDGTEPIGRMVLHVFKYRATSDFCTTLTAPNFTMTPALK